MMDKLRKNPPAFLGGGKSDRVEGLSFAEVH
jgi:hypothetical protein